MNKQTLVEDFSINDSMQQMLDLCIIGFKMLLLQKKVLVNSVEDNKKIECAEFFFSVKEKLCKDFIVFSWEIKDRI